MMTNNGLDLNGQPVPCKFCKNDTNKVMAISVNDGIYSNFAEGLSAGESACLHCWIRFVAIQAVKDLNASTRPPKD